MELKTTYEIVKARYPELVKEIMIQLAKSTSKEKGAKPEDLKWKFDWCVGGKSFSFSEVLARKPIKEEESLDAKLRNYSESCHVCLSGSKGHWRGSSKIEIPIEIIDQKRDLLEKEEAEKKRFNGLSKKEQDKELGEILTELHKDPGFFAFHL